MSSPEVQRELGAHAAEITNLKDRVEKMDGKMDEVLSILNQTKGSWKTLVAIAGMSSAIGAAAAKVAPMFMAIPR